MGSTRLARALAASLAITLVPVCGSGTAAAMDQTPTVCAAGFTEVSNTRALVTCVRSEHAESADEADRTADQLKQRQGCSGTVTEQKASVADNLGGDWLVTMLFSCENDE